jgi:hypothetical protein
MSSKDDDKKKIKASGKASPDTCPFCHAAIADGAVVTCPRCSAAHHVDCWSENDGCAVVSCIDEAKLEQPQSSITCPTCGANTDAAASFCGSCGAGLAAGPTPPAQAPALPAVHGVAPGSNAQQGSNASPSGKPSTRTIPWKVLSLIGVVAAVILIVVNIGSSGPSAEDTQDAADAKYSRCESQIGELVDAVGEIGDRLELRLSFDDYSALVADANVAYGRVDFKALDSECVTTAGEPIEDALNEHIDAQSTWSDCNDDYYCDSDSIDPELQDHWSAASSYVDDARAGMSGLRTPNPQ